MIFGIGKPFNRATGPGTRQARRRAGRYNGSMPSQGAQAPVAPPAQPKVRPARPAEKIEAETKDETKLAPRYRVLIHNDDVTPMDFVVKVLMQVFGLNGIRAMKVMLEAHLKGVALVTVLPLEEAEFRVEKAHSMARGEKYPLTFSYEPVE